MHFDYAINHLSGLKGNNNNNNKKEATHKLKLVHIMRCRLHATAEHLHWH